MLLITGIPNVLDDHLNLCSVGLTLFPWELVLPPILPEEPEVESIMFPQKELTTRFTHVLRLFRRIQV